MKPPVTMVCSIPVSAAWNAFCRCCSLPAMTNSTAAAFMPATASSVITSNSSSATTSAAPRCLPPPPVLKCVFVTTGILWLNLSTRCGSEWFSRPTGAGSQGLAPQRGHAGLARALIDVIEVDDQIVDLRVEVLTKGAGDVRDQEA